VGFRLRSLLLILLWGLSLLLLLLGWFLCCLFPVRTPLGGSLIVVVVVKQQLALLDALKLITIIVFTTVDTFGVFALTGSRI